jgi:hypothetical protein
MYWNYENSLQQSLGDYNMNGQGIMSARGDLSIKVIRADRPSLKWIISNRFSLRYFKGWLAEYVLAPVARQFGTLVALGKLEAVLIRADGTKVNYGVLSRRVVTDAFVAFVVDQLQTESSLFGDFKYHDSGVGSTAEAAANTAMETTDGEARATGTQTESAANAYRSVGTISYTTTKAITEHGLFNDLTAGTLMDRSVFTAVNVINGDSIQFTYTLTLTAGG